MIIDDPGTFLPIWMMLSAAFGFMIGDACGDNFRHRKCLQHANEDLRDQLQNAHRCEELLHRAIKQQRGIIHDIHKHVVAVSKGLENPLSKPSEINGRISPIRPFQNL
jgi:hypothetical protein